MATVSEQIELLGKGLYCKSKSNIPDVLTIKSIPTVSELDYVGSEGLRQSYVRQDFHERKKITFRTLGD